MAPARSPSGAILLASVLLLALAPGLASAITVSITADDAGFVTEMGGSAKGDGTVTPPATFNYSVGREEHYADGSLSPPPFEYMFRKNYFAFDLSAVTGPITSATLVLYMGPDEGPPFPDGEHGYESLDPTETYELFEITDPGGALALMADLAMLNTVGTSEFDDPTDPGVTKAKDLYDKLADGPLLMGGIVTSPADDDTFLSIPITPGGLGYLDMFAGGFVPLGGVLSTATPPASPPDAESQLIFGFTGPDIPGGDPLSPVLVIEFVPEPGTGALLALGLGVLAWRRRR